MVQNLREVSLHHIIILPVKFRKIHIEKYMKMSLIHYFFLQEVKVAEVKVAGVKVEVEMRGG